MLVHASDRTAQGIGDSLGVFSPARLVYGFHLSLWAYFISDFDISLFIIFIFILFILYYVRFCGWCWKIIFSPSKHSGCQNLNFIVYLATEALAVVRQSLWRHKCRSPGRAGEQGIVPFKLVTNTKISNLHMAVISKQQIWGFDVPVDDLLIVHWGAEERKETQNGQTL